MAKAKKRAKKTRRSKVIKRKVLIKKKAVKSVKKVLVKKKMKSEKRKAKKKITPRRRKKIVAKRKPKIKRAILKKKVRKKAKAKKTKKIIKKINRSLPKKKLPESGVSALPSGSFFKAKIKVIGIGGGGGSIVSEIGRSLEKASFVIADTDIRALKKRPGTKYFWFGENLTRGLGTGANPELAKKAAEQAKERLSGILKDQDIIIFIASLGGGLGSGATQIFAEVARDFGGITFGIFTLPFKFEGKNKHKIAQNALKSLRPLLNVSLSIPNEKIFKIINANTPITEAFSIINKNLTGSLESLIELIYNPGVINIDFADLRTILKGRGNLAFLNTIEESGKNRADKICEKVLLNPLLQTGNFEVEKILFNISGSDNLSMFEVEKISRHIADLNPAAKIIFGISKTPKLKSKIKTTILMTGGGIKEKFAKEAPEVIKSAEQPIKEIKTQESPKKLKIIKKKGKKKQKKQTKKGGRKEQKEQEETLVPVFGNVPVASDLTAVGERKLSVIETGPKGYPESSKKAIRRSGLEIKKAQEQEELKKAKQEKEWEIPAFLRRVKFKS